MKKGIFIVVVVVSFFSCEKKVETDILPRKKFISLLVQMHLIEADFSFNSQVDHKSMKKNYTRYEDLFKRYKTDSLQVMNTFNYYDDKLAELDTIYNIVLDSLNIMAGNVKPPLQNPVK
jgi:hypothetical protein